MAGWPSARSGAGHRLLAGACLALTLLALPVACRRAPPEGGGQASEAAPPSEVAPPPAAPAPRAVLRPAAPMDRVLRGGETHRFAVDLAADQLLDLRVDQHGVDVVVTLLGPLGEPLLEVDNPSGADGARGAERVVWVAATLGSYTVAIRAWGGESAAGTYRIELEKPRLAGARDRDRAAAEKAKAEADVLFGLGTAEARVRAIDRYQEALAGFQALNDVHRQADVRYRLAMSWRALGEEARQFEELEVALSLYQKTANEPQQAQCRHQLCYLLKGRNELDSALDQCRAALGLWEAAGDRLGLARTAQELGFVYRLLNEGHRALTLYDRALELYRELGRPPNEAKTLHNRGRLYATLGQRAQALADLEEALAIRRRLGDERDIAIYLNSLGLLHARWHDMGKARDAFAQALTRREAMGADDAAISLTGLGWADLESDPARSADSLRQALEIFRQEGDRSWQAHTLLLSARLAAVGDSPTRIPEALTLALQLFEAGQDLGGTAEARLAIAGALRRLGRLSEAQGEIEKALEIVEDLRTRVAASLDDRAAFFATKQAYYDLYIDLLMERHQELPSAGFDASALQASERARARSLIEALSERASGSQEVDPALLEAELQLQRQIGSRQLQIEGLLAGAKTENEDRLARLKDEQRDLLRRYDKLQGDIRLRSPQYADLTQPQLPSVADLQRMLGPGTLLLEYRLGESRSWLWVVTVDTLDAFELPPRAEIEEAARRVVGFISRRQPESATRSKRRAERALADLSRLLLRDVSRQVAGADRLLIVTDGALQYLPFEVLTAAGSDSDPGPPELLIAGPSEIVYLPSASTLAVLRGRLLDRRPAPRQLAVVADPVFTADDPRQPRPTVTAPSSSGARSAEAAGLRRLIYTADEAQTILDLAPADSRFAALGFDASRDVVTGGELGRYRIIHLATHGELNTEHAELSRLVLSLFDREGQPRGDGFLYAYEVYGLELPAELVVLSACQTALGEQIQGEGLLGLTRGFMHAGAARVVVSLWRVEDQATAALMGLFYDNLLVKGMAPPAALRAAKSSIRQQAGWRDPYYWAGFVFQGEWRDWRR